MTATSTERQKMRLGIRSGVWCVAASLALLSACEKKAPPAPTVAAAPTVDLAAVHADAPGIDWFKGDVDAAFASARAANKPVLLYWGAQWCPPCKQLKSSVFNRPDFIEKSRLFVAVYLDGDLPDAQKWGDVFRVTGYPTVVVFKPDRTEITRLAGNMDLSLYAGVLDDALADMRPIQEVVALAVKAEAPLAPADCRRLAYHAFDLDDDGVFDRARLQTAFENAGRLCAAEQATERARFVVLAATQAAERQAEALDAGQPADKALAALILRVHALLSNQPLALANTDALRGLPKQFYVAARRNWPQVAPELRTRVLALADAATASAQFAPADQLAAQLMKVRVAQAYAQDGKTPTDVRSVALATADKMLSARMEPYVRAGVVNSAINIYIALDDWPRARDLLALEATTSNTPHYYLGDLADVEEHLGNKPRALELLAEAYAKAKGPASRFQWGFNYLTGLLRLAPGDLATIEKVGGQVIGELDGPNRVHRRTLSRLSRLDSALREWTTDAQRGAVVSRLRGKLLTACAQSSADAAAAKGCQDFGGGIAAT